MATTTLEQLDATAYRDSVKLNYSQLITWLLEHIGQRITAVALGLSDASMLPRYKKGVAPREDRIELLRLLYRLSRMVADAFDAETARAFLTSSNPQLADQSPLLVLRNQAPAKAGPEVLGAARTLIDG